MWLANIGIKSKLIATMVFVCLLPLGAVEFLASQYATNAFETQAFKQLDSVRGSKKAHIEDLFSTVQHQVRTFSQSPMIVKAMQEFRTSMSMLPEEIGDADPLAWNHYRKTLTDYYENDFGDEYRRLNDNSSISVTSLIPTSLVAAINQYTYIAGSDLPLGMKDELIYAGNATTYDQIHKRYHPSISAYQRRFGYYDIFLIDPQTGDIVYSVFKEIDFATSLISGPFKDTNFASIFKKTRLLGNRDAVGIADFEPYLPSYDAPAAFIASPIYDENELIGILAFQMPIGHINKVMMEHSGLGDTGETYLVGTDGRMRSQSRFREENTILTAEVETVAVDALRNNHSASEKLINYRGEPVLSSYAPLSIDGLNWGIIAEVSQVEALHHTVKFRYILAAILLGGIGLALILGTISGNSLYRQLGTEPTQLLRMVEDAAKEKFDHDEISPATRSSAQGVFAGMLSMQKQLLESQKSSKTKFGRITAALDKATANIMLTDESLKIVYMNAAAKELFFSSESMFNSYLDSFDSNQMIGMKASLLLQEAAVQESDLLTLTSAISREFRLGDSVFSVTASPVFDDANGLSGVIMEWNDKTLEVSIQEEMSAIVSSALRGDLGQRIKLENKSGFFEELSRGVNDLVSYSERVIGDVLRVLGALANGNLTETIQAEYEGAFGQLKNDANTTVEKLTAVVDQIQLASRLVNSGADEIAAGNATLNQRTEQQAEKLSVTASNMEEMTTTVKQNAQNVSEADLEVISLLERAEHGGGVVRKAIVAMEEINNSSQKISDIIGVIDEITFQTNLLSLNAAVEAARAGEQGRGFAVVASEVRKLAGRSATAAREIKELIKDSSSKVKDGFQLVNKSGDTLEEIVSGVKRISEIVTELAAASRQQSIGLDYVNSTISEIDGLTQQNATLVEKAAQASESLGEQASALEELVDFFVTSRNAATPLSLENVKQEAVIS